MGLFTRKQLDSSQCDSSKKYHEQLDWRRFPHRDLFGVHNKDEWTLKCSPLFEASPRHLALVEGVVVEATESKGTLTRAYNYEGPCRPASISRCARIGPTVYVSKWYNAHLQAMRRESGERTHTRATVCAYPSRSTCIFCDIGIAEPTRRSTKCKLHPEPALDPYPVTCKLPKSFRTD